MEKKLQRDENRKMLAGVAAGLGEYFDIEVTWVRVIFILMAVFGLSGVLLYIILWIVVPAKPYFADIPKYEADYRVHDSGEPVYSPNQPFGKPLRKQGNGRFVAGIILVAVGAYFLMNEFYILPYWFSLAKLWPVILIVIGIVILGRSGKKDGFNDYKGNDYKEKPNPSFDTEKKEDTTDKPGDQPLV